MKSYLSLEPYTLRASGVAVHEIAGKIKRRGATVEALQLPLPRHFDAQTLQV